MMMDEFKYIVIGVTVTFAIVILFHKFKTGSSVKESTEKVLNIFDVMKTIGSAVATIGIISTGIYNFSGNSIVDGAKNLLSSDKTKVASAENITKTTKNNETNNTTNANNSTVEIPKGGSNKSISSSITTSDFAKPPAPKEYMPQTKEEVIGFIKSHKQQCEKFFNEYMETIGMAVYENRITDYEKAYKVNKEFLSKAKDLKENYSKFQDKWWEGSYRKAFKAEIPIIYFHEAHLSLQLLEGIEGINKAFEYEMEMVPLNGAASSYHNKYRREACEALQHLSHCEMYIVGRDVLGNPLKERKYLPGLIKEEEIK